MKIRIRIILLVVWIICILFLTGYPKFKTSLSVGLGIIDKILHFILFFVLGIFEFRILKTFFFFTLGLAVIFLSELQQLFIPGRFFELFDIIAGVLGLTLSYFILKRSASKKHALSKT